MRIQTQTHPDAVDEKPRTGEHFQYSSDRACKHLCNVSDRWVDINQPTDKAREKEVPRHSFVSLCTFARFVSFSLFAAVSHSSCIKFHQQENRHGWWVWALSCLFPAALFLFFLPLFCCFGFVLVVNPASLRRTIGADTLPACTNLCTLFMFFSCGLSCPVSVCGFGLVWFFFVWMGKDFVLELLCVRVSFPSEAPHMTAACIRSSRADVLGFFWWRWNSCRPRAAV